MKVIMFIIENIDNILLIIGGLVSLCLLVKRGETKILKQILFNLVTEAEQIYGEGTGSLKYATVVDWLYERIPAPLKTLYSAKDIEKLIENALAQAKTQWAANINLDNYIKNEES